MKFKLMKRSIKDQEVEHINDLAEMGMSHKCIAKEVYGTTSNGGASLNSLQRIQNLLSSQGIRVTDYRNAKNQHGKSVIAAIRREANVLESIRAAQKRVVASLRKTG